MDDKFRKYKKLVAFPILVLVVFSGLISCVSNTVTNKMVLKPTTQTPTPKPSLKNTDSPKSAVENNILTVDEQKIIDELGSVTESLKNQMIDEYRTGLQFYNKNNYQDSITHYQKALDLAGSPILFLYQTIGDVYKTIQDYNNSLKYYNEGIAFAEELKDNFKVIKFLLSAGDACVNNSRISNKSADEAISYFQKAVIYCDLTGDKNSKHHALYQIAFMYSMKSDYNESLKYCSLAYELSLELKDYRLQLIDLFGIGDGYRNLKEYEKSLNAFNKALKLSIDNNDKQNQVYYLAAIGYVYIVKEEWDNALKIYNDALDVVKGTNNKDDQVSILQKIASVYDSKKDYDMAVIHYLLAAEIDHEINSWLSEMNDLRNVAYIYRYKKMDNTRALEYYKQVMSLVEEYNFDYYRKETADAISTLENIN